MSTDKKLTWEEARTLAYQRARQRFGHEDAEDIAQTVCLELFADKLAPERGLVVERATSRCADLARSESARTRRNKDWTEDTYDTLRAMTRGMESWEIEDFLQVVTPRQRVVMAAVLVHGYTQEEVAEELGVSREAVKQLVQRGISTLRRHGG